MTGVTAKPPIDLIFSMFETNQGRWINDSLKEEINLLKLLITFDYNNLTKK